MPGRRSPARLRAQAVALQAAALAGFLAALTSAGGGPAAPDEQALADRAAGLARVLEEQVERALTRLAPLARQVATGEPLDWRAFSRALDPGDGSPADRSLVLWAPQVPAQARADYELHSGRHAFRSFHIRDPDGQGGLHPARTRPEHFPVHLTDPPTAGNPLLGLDLLSDPNIAGAITRARRSGQPEVLLPPRSPLTPGTGSRLLIVVPVAGGPHRPGAGSDLQGVLLTALPLPALAADRPPLLDPTLAIRLTPWTTPPRSAPPAWTPPRAEPPASWSWAPPPTRVPFFVRGQPWALELARPRR